MKGSHSRRARPGRRKTPASGTAQRKSTAPAEAIGPGAPAGAPLVAAGVDLSRLLVREVKDYAIFLLDVGGHVLSWNEGAALISGYRLEEVRGRHFRMFYTAEDQAARKPEFEMEMATELGRFEDVGWRLRKDGTRFWADEIITAVYEGSKKPVAFTKITRDLTVRKAAEDALRQSESRYRQVVEGVRDYVIISMDPRRIVTHANHAAQIILGYAEHEIVGRSSDIIFTPEDRAAGGPEKEQHQADTMGRAEDERWHVRKDGSRFWGSGVLTPVRDEPGLTTGYFKVLRDRTERKRAEQERARLLDLERKARETAEAATRLKDEFLAVASHELRTPLSAILLWSHLLRTGTLDEAGTAEALAIVEQSAKAQQALIEDLLDVSRVAAGKLRLNIQPTGLATIIRAATDAVRPMAAAKGVTLKSSLDPAVGKVRADADRLQQVAWNLLTNAVKFSEPGGKVWVRLVRAGNEVRLVVSDTGQGIRPEFLPHVFDRFRQEDPSTTRREGGLGLGLSITKQLVELHGGVVTAESAGVGKGATFTVTLPLPAVSPVRSRRAKPPKVVSGDGMDDAFVPSSILSGVWVLLVEDDEHTRRAVAWVLEQSGAEVTAVPSAVEALKAVEAAMTRGSLKGLAGQYPQVLLSDVGMAGMDGYEMIQRIRALEAERGRPPLPAAALTAYAREEDRQKAIASGFQMHLRKPVEPQEVVQTVARLAGRS